MQTEGDKVEYKVSLISHGYTLLSRSEKTLEAIWGAEKCWFGPGQRVLIEDDKGNFKIFEKEKME